MKLLSFRTSKNTKIKIGILKDNRIIDLSKLDKIFDIDMITFLENNFFKKKAELLTKNHSGHYFINEILLEAPISKPGKFLAIGMNYKQHAEEAIEMGIQIPDYQLWFNKQTTCINGPYSPIVIPKISDKLDYEVELAIVIGKKCKNVKLEEAQDVIAGFMVCNDVSVRDWQMHTMTFTMGKSFDTHGPIGPWIVTSDEIKDPHSLNLKCYVNNQLMQNDSTKNLIYNIYQQIEYLSTAFTLEVGDIIATGTPSGVGATKVPPLYLKKDDIVRCEIEDIGYIENKVIGE